MTRTTTTQTNTIYEFSDPTHVDVLSLERGKILWIFDIDETVVRAAPREAIADNATRSLSVRDLTAYSPEMKEWMAKILKNNNHAICFLTARYPPATDEEREAQQEVMHLLGLSEEEEDKYYTLQGDVRLFNYTGGMLKGSYAKELISKYLLKEQYDAIFFLDDRLTQVDDVLTHCSTINNIQVPIFGIWISQFSDEKYLAPRYAILKKS